MTFYAQELEGVCPAYGWQGGPNGNTQITPLKTRQEHRVALGEIALHSFILPFQNITSEAYLQYLKAAHMAMWAMTHSFLVKDWMDFQGVGESLGVAPSGSTPVQLQKTYWFGLASRTRDITKPISATVYQADGSGNPIVKPGTFSTTTGLFTPDSGWTAGRALTADFEFRVPVRFNNDSMPMTIETRSGNQHVISGSVELIEVIGE